MSSDMSMSGAQRFLRRCSTLSCRLFAKRMHPLIAAEGDVFQRVSFLRTHGLERYCSPDRLASRQGSAYVELDNKHIRPPERRPFSGCRSNRG
jgi:hypothetical protein